MSISHERRTRRTILLASVVALAAGARVYAVAGAGASVTGAATG